MSQPEAAPERPATAIGPVEAIELLTLRTVTAAVREGLSLEGTAGQVLEQTLQHLGLEFGSVYVKRHDYLICLVSRGWSLPAHPEPLIELAGADAWPQRPFVAHQADASLAAQRAWMSLPLRINGNLVGVVILGGYGLEPEALPSLPLVRRVADHLAVAIDNAERIETVRGFLNDTRDVIFRTDARGRWTFLNPAWQETFGESVASALGRRVHTYILPSERSKLGPGIEALVPHGAVIGRQTLPFLVSHGKTRWMDVQARLLRDDRGQVVGTAGVLRDVSLSVRQSRELARANRELRRRAEELEEAYRALTETDRLKSEFLATVSHELRTPLNIVSGYTEMLIDGVPDDPTEGQQEYLGFVLEGVQRLEGLIRNLLDLASIEAGTVCVECEPLPLAPCLERTAERLAGRAAESGLSLELLPPPEGVAVSAQPDRLEQVLGILLDNAFKFGRPGGRAVVACHPRNEAEPALPLPDDQGESAGFVQITVTDDGLGVPPDHQPRLFRKFVQADGSDTRRHGGLGIGLVIARAVVERMGGRIALYSEGEDRGTAVGFTLPRA